MARHMRSPDLGEGEEEFPLRRLPRQLQQTKAAAQRRPQAHVQRSKWFRATQSGTRYKEASHNSGNTRKLVLQGDWRSSFGLTFLLFRLRHLRLRFREPQTLIFIVLLLLFPFRDTALYFIHDPHALVCFD
jgi:hypothetical protein